MNFSNFSVNSDRILLHKGLPATSWPSDKTRWNISSKEDYADTNNQNNASSRTIHQSSKPFLDFYVTFQHPGDSIMDDMRFPGALNLRVTRPIIANNAGGAGYLSIPTSYVSLGDVTHGFLETLKAVNFNTGNAQNTSV